MDASKIVSPQPGVLRGEGLKKLKVQNECSIFIEKGVIKKIGPRKVLEKEIPQQTSRIDLSGKTVMPGFVDSHTHLVFGGKREREFARRCSGTSYEEIAAEGGGILSTVNATREISKEDLVNKSLLNLERAVRQGITSMEIKSGYGLNRETELKMLEVINELNARSPLDLVATFLGAHAVPPETDKKHYIKQIKEIIPEAAKLARFCDVFCEKGYFSAQETAEILKEAEKFGLKPRVHVNQFNNLGGVSVAVKAQAASVDHLEEISNEDIEILADSETCATLLPGVSLFLNIKYPPGRKIIDAGCIPVLATDFNPGSSMTLCMSLILNLACTQMGFSMEEAIAASTQNAAFSLGLEKVGCLEPGWQGDLIVLDSDNYYNLVYFFGEHHIEKVFKKGSLIWDRTQTW